MTWDGRDDRGATLPASVALWRTCAPGFSRVMKLVLDAWREEYNNRRPHGSLGQRTPAEYRAEVEAAEAPEQVALSEPECSSVG
jgi:hypothetical protein